MSHTATNPMAARASAAEVRRQYRIAHVVNGRCNPDSANGVDKTVYHVSHTQSERGHAVLVISITDKCPIPIPGVTVLTAKPTRFHDPAAVLQIMSEWVPDVVHLHSSYIPLNARLARVLRQRGVPYVVTPNGALARQVLGTRSFVKRVYGSLVERPMLHGAAFIHSVGDTVSIGSYGARAPVVVAPNAVHVPSNLPALSSSTVVPAPYALFLGRLAVQQKGLDLLLTGFAQVAAAFPEWTLVLAGPDWRSDRHRLDHLGRSLGIAHRILLPGPVWGTQKDALIAGADLFVHTSRWEGLPFSVLEAFALSRACLLTDAADPLGILMHTGAGIRCECSATGVADGLATLFAASRDNRLDMGRRGRTFVDSNVSWANAASQLEAGYLEHCGL